MIERSAPSIYGSCFIQSCSTVSMNGGAGQKRHGLSAILTACDISPPPTALEYFRGGGNGQMKTSPNKRGIGTRDTIPLTVSYVPCTFFFLAALKTLILCRRPREKTDSTHLGQ